VRIGYLAESNVCGSGLDLHQNSGSGAGAPLDSTSSIVHACQWTHIFV